MSRLEWTAVKYEHFTCGVAIANQKIVAVVATDEQSEIYDALQSRLLNLHRKLPQLGKLPDVPTVNNPVGRTALEAIGDYCDNPGHGETAFRHLISDCFIKQHATSTPFEKQVWIAIKDIPVGRTLSYAALASEIGRPTAVRAVASACGKNPWAIVVPCHRVIRSDGGLGGYHWGLNIKRQLLNKEANWRINRDFSNDGESIPYFSCQKQGELI